MNKSMLEIVFKMKYYFRWRNEPVLINTKNLSRLTFVKKYRNGAKLSRRGYYFLIKPNAI